MKQKKNSKGKEAATKRAPALQREREQFRGLLLENPNYFGNLADSDSKPVKKIIANKRYEEIGGIGFQPQFNRLEAVVLVKQPTGFGGDICSSGTQEYVRFYVKCGGSDEWEDVGLSSFTAYNIPDVSPGKKHLEYAVSLNVDLTKSLCFHEKICEVRAILSWNDIPPPDQPDWPPVWGEVVETFIQVDASQFKSLKGLLEESGVKMKAEWAQLIDMDQKLSVTKKKKLDLQEKATLYAKKKVEPHRFALQEMTDFIDNPSLSTGHLFSGLGIKPGKYVEQLYSTDGNTSYEELEYVGYNPKLQTLVATIRVKKKWGYSGNLCTDGSKEFVTFWADMNNNGTYETYLGTTSVNVYDIKSVSKKGLEYAAFLPVNFNRFRRPCEDGPVLIPIRAVLSWQKIPPFYNPKYIPTWGNREDTLICLRPGQAQEPGTYYPMMQLVGGMDVDDINSSGYANGIAPLAGFEAHDSPFGGLVTIAGYISPTTDISEGATKLKYKVEVSNDDGGSWQLVGNPFWLGRDQWDGEDGWIDLPSVRQAVDDDGFYEYQEDIRGTTHIRPVGNVLARWQTAGLNGLYVIRVVAKLPPDDTTLWESEWVYVHLDNTRPEPMIRIDSGDGDCADFTIGDEITGTYEAFDDHFKHLTLKVLPTRIAGLPSGGQFTAPASLPPDGMMPLVRTYRGGVPGTGESQGWTLDTAGMVRCGYVIEIGVRDRTIVDSGGKGHSRRDTVGLCLREADE